MISEPFTTIPVAGNRWDLLVFTGTRVGVGSVAEMKRAGLSDEQVRGYYPDVTDRMICAAEEWDRARERRGISSHPDIQGGVLCFTGTRIPVASVISFLEAGQSIAQILREYPGLTPQDVEDAWAWNMRNP